MLVDFDSLEDSARVWIYQSSREFSEDEIVEISEKMTNFLINWKRHGDNLKSSFRIDYNHFIILAVDESYNDVSGCSIDASVNFIKQLEKEYSVNLTNRLLVSFKDQHRINIVSLEDFQKYVSKGKISSTTTVFNNMISTKEDFGKNWEVPAHKSWHRRFFNNN